MSKAEGRTSSACSPWGHRRAEGHLRRRLRRSAYPCTPAQRVMHCAQSMPAAGSGRLPLSTATVRARPETPERPGAFGARHCSLRFALLLPRAHEGASAITCRTSPTRLKCQQRAEILGHGLRDQLSVPLPARCVRPCCMLGQAWHCRAAGSGLSSLQYCQPDASGHAICSARLGIAEQQAQGSAPCHTGSQMRPAMLHARPGLALQSSRLRAQLPATLTARCVRPCCMLGRAWHCRAGFHG